MTTPTPRDHLSYSRILSTGATIAVGASVSIGLAVFGLLGPFLDSSGIQGSVSGFAVAGIAGLLFSIAHAERAIVTPGKSGVYTLAKSSNTVWVFYATGWLALAGYTVLISLLGWGAAIHIDWLLQSALDMTLSPLILTFLVIGIVLLRSLVSNRPRRRAQTVMFWLAILLVTVLIVRALWQQAGSGQTTSYLSSDLRALGAAALMVPAWWGLTLVLNARDEIRRPVRTLPRALIGIVLLTMLLGMLAVLVIGRSVLPYPLPAAPLAYVLGSVQLVDTPLVLFGLALVAVMLCTAGIYTVFTNTLRLFDDMATDGLFPGWMQSVLGFRGRPAALLITQALLAAAAIQLLPLVHLIGVACILFCAVTALVHAPDILRREPTLPAGRRFKLPFHPLVPVIVVAVSALLPASLPLTTWLACALIAAVGAVWYFAYARRAGAAVRRRELVAEASEDADDLISAESRVLVAVANPDRAPGLITMGARFARAKNADLVVLSVLHLTEQWTSQRKQATAQAAWQQLRALIDAQDIADVATSALVRLAPEPSDGILAALHEVSVDLLVMGWDVERRHPDAARDAIVDRILRRAPCDVVVVHGEVPSVIHHALVPAVGSRHTLAALALAQDVVDADVGDVSLLHVVKPTTRAEDRDAALQMLQETELEARHSAVPVKSQLVVGASVLEGVVEQASATDVVLFGASEDALLGRVHLGGLPVNVLSEIAKPALIVRDYEAPDHPWLERLWGTLTDPLPRISAERRRDVAADMRQSAVPTIDFYVLIFLASVIASFGLLQNSGAVIIGAMLVAPLMSPILASAMGMVLGEPDTLRMALEATVKGIAVAVLTGIAIALFSPIDGVTPEIMARTQPNILDMMVALASGAAAGYAVCRKEVAAALPGVAIAAALVPPLCVVGYGVGTGDLGISLGSSLLFITNLIAIILSAALVFLALGFFPGLQSGRGDLVRGLKMTVVSLGIVGAVLLVATITTVVQENRQLAVSRLLSQGPLAEVAEVESLVIERDRDGYLVTVQIISLSDDVLTVEEIEQLEADMVEALGGVPVELNATIIQAEQTDFDAVIESRRIVEAFEAALSEVDVLVEDAAVSVSGNSAELNAHLITFVPGTLTEDALVEIQEQVSAESGYDVTLDLTIVPGRRTQISPDS